MAQTRLIGTAPEQVPTNGMLGTIAFQDASSVNLGSVSVQQLLAPLGTAGAPTITFTGDPNTGLYSPGADQVAISTGGTGRLFVDSSGRLGIGTSSPANLLHIQGDSTFDANTGGQFVIRGSTITNNRLHIGFDTTSNYAWLQAITVGTAYRPICLNPAGGSVGINTTAPSTILEIASASPIITVSDPASASNGDKTGEIRFTRPSVNWLNGRYSANQHEFYVQGTERARIDSSGRLLVGTSASTATAFVESNFQLKGGNYNNGTASFIVENNSNGNTSSGLYLGRGAGSGGTLVTSGWRLGFVNFLGGDGTGYSSSAASIDCFVDGTPGAGDMPGRLHFSTTADGASSATERLRIANDGRHTINSSAHQGTALTTTAPAKLYTSTGTYTDTATTASGTVTHGTIVAFDNPAIAATNATVTYTNASTVYIDGAPTNGTNVTITNPFALFVAAGASRFGGNVLSSSATGGIGYATGAGSAQTQATSRTQGVTINTICGAITLFSAAGTTTWQSFTVTNSTVAATDTIRVNQKSGTDLYMIHVTNVAAGSFQITYATTGGTTTEQPVFNFSVIKAVAA